MFRNKVCIKSKSLKQERRVVLKQLQKNTVEWDKFSPKQSLGKRIS